MTTRPRRWLFRLLVAGLLALLGTAVGAPAATAHPLGNFSINTYNGLRVEPESVSVRMIVDSAEIPTVQQFPEVNEQGGVSDTQAEDFAAEQCDRLAPGAELSIGGVPQQLRVESSEIAFVPGAGGLQTMRLTCELRTAEPVDTVGQDLEYVDENSLDRTGWRELTAVGDGVGLSGNEVAGSSVSDELTDYPQDLLSSPLDQREVSLEVVAGSGDVEGDSAAEKPAEAVEGAGRLTAAFTDLVASRDLGLGFALVAFSISIVLGGLHAFAPGHGKTLMAAYMLGQRKSLRQVAIIGLTVTLTHTTGVLVLGVVLSAVAITAPALIYSWLGLAAGLLLVVVGVNLLRQALRQPASPGPRSQELAPAGAPHGHADGAGHAHGDGHDQADEHAHHEPASGVTHSHGPGGTHTHAVPSTATGARGLVAVGLIGGMVPSPSALVVLLAGIALGRAWFGVLLVLGYGIGMALALTGTGLALAYARDRLERWSTRKRATGRWGWVLRATRALPALTAGLVIVVGVGLAIRAAVSLPL